MKTLALLEARIKYINIGGLHIRYHSNFISVKCKSVRISVNWIGLLIGEQHNAT